MEEKQILVPEHHHLIDKLALVNGFVSGLALYPQVWTIFAAGSTAGVSLSSFGIIFLNSAVWLLYAMHRKLVSLAIASLLNLIASGALVAILLLS